ncbi:hypothetical protein MLD38_008068 [Melastoma candidum]|uniref:Uncharacterized protein n=1 Tax=Melastoma candidum TaxID=119954 RepID=A0ACB9RT43_9MYRT|nr:hypothetical protein MLD38_008068 [Melastoma candidum]
MSLTLDRVFKVEKLHIQEKFKGSKDRGNTLEFSMSRNESFLHAGKNFITALKHAGRVYRSKHQVCYVLHVRFVIEEPWSPELTIFHKT